MGLEKDDRRAPHLQAIEALRAAIRDGTYAPGDRLPGAAELAAEYGVTRMAIQRAVAVLRDEGLIVSWQGRGTYVRARPGDESADTRSEYDEIMQRLDSMCDEIQRLEERLARLELQPPAVPAAPGERWRSPGNEELARSNGRSRSAAAWLDGRAQFGDRPFGAGDAASGDAG